MAIKVSEDKVAFRFASFLPCIDEILSILWMNQCSPDQYLPTTAFFFQLKNAAATVLEENVMTPATVELSESALRNHESLPACSRKIGKPRCNPREAFLHTFYERLLLLEMLQWRLGRLEPDPATDPGTSVDTHPWGSFLEQLAWLCDYTNGGDSTSGIAVEATSVGPKYWIAANFDPDKKSESHLEFVLEKLASLQSLHLNQHQAILEEIVQESLLFSAEKLENYRRMVLTKIRIAKDLDPGSFGSAGK